MTTFYKGNSILDNKNVKGYLEGYELNSLNEKIPLKQGTNKYNIELIKQVNELNYKFYILILSERIIIKLIEMNSNNEYGEIRNIWNLIKAQGATIRYNRVFRKALKSYLIDKQKIYNALKTEVDKQLERLDRNKKVLTILMNDYGLKSLISEIEKHNNMDIYEHIEKFVNSLDKDITFDVNQINEENTNDYYNDIVDKYIEYVISIANKNNISIDNNVSESLKHYRDNKRDYIKQAKLEAKQKKIEDKENGIINKLKDDNAKIQQDIAASYYNKLVKLDRSQAGDLFSKIDKLGGYVWYISLAKGSKVCYLCNTRKTVSSILKAVLFLTKDDAEKFLDYTIKENEEIKSYHTYIARLITNVSNNVNRLNNVIVKDSSDAYFFYDACIGDKISVNDAKFVKEALLKTNGHLVNKSNVNAIVYKALPKDEITVDISQVKFIKTEGNKVEVVDKLYDAEVFALSDASEDKLRYLHNSLPEFNIEPYNIQFSSKWYENQIKDLYKAHKDLLNALNNKYPNKPQFKCTDTLIEELKNRLEEFKHQGIMEVYYLIDKKKEISFYKDQCKAKRTLSVGIMTLFTSKQDAYNAYFSEYNPKGTSVIRIMNIKLD
ncbi:MAG: hypothetical protein J6A59_00545 [Lachnospiraceae bacterium]|nr:hypothetical protein [Lachnospiraceae bacterium]